VAAAIGGDFGSVLPISREKKNIKQKLKEYLFKNKEKMKSFTQFNVKTKKWLTKIDIMLFWVKFD